VRLIVVYTTGLNDDLPSIENVNVANDAPLSMGFDSVAVVHLPHRDVGEVVEFCRNYDQIVIVKQGTYRERGWTYPQWQFDTANSVVTLSWRGLSLFGPFKNIMARWVLRHELGHVRGLKHHPDPFCLMCPVNVSFGRFCRECTRRLRENA